MSLFDRSPVPVRLNRSQLSVPGIRPELFEKAAKSAADIIFLDLEDSVSSGDKDKARRNVIEGLNRSIFAARRSRCASMAWIRPICIAT